MAYTRVWNETTPVGDATQASDIDLVIQQLKQDIRERMNTIVTDFTTDPVASNISVGTSVYSTVPLTNSVNPLAWNAERFDTSAFHDLTVNNSRLTIPASLGGIYTIDCRLLLVTTIINETLALQLRKNGTTIIQEMWWTRVDTNNAQVGLAVNSVELLVAGDYVEVLLTRLTGTNTATTLGGINYTSFSIRGR